MNGLISWWARNSVAANLLMVGIFFAGMFGFGSLEREMEPQVRFPGLEIQVVWPGAEPQEIEEQIVARIEESVSDMDAIEWVRSSSGEGVGAVYILAEQRVDFTQFMNEVKVRVDSIASFPRDIEPPRVQQWVNRNEFIRIAVHGEGLTERELKRLAEELRREVATLPAITVVQLFGTRSEEVSIEVSETALRRYGLNFSQVADAIRNASINQSAGQVRTDVGTYQLKVRNQADNEQEFGDIIIRESSAGGTVRVRDVAQVVDGFEDNPILATLNGEPAVLIQVMTSETMDIVKASNSVNEWIAKRQDTLPAGSKLTLWTDNAEDFKGRMATIGSAAGQGLILVLLVLLLTLRPKVAFWVTVGIATAYAGAFVFLPSVGVSLNMLSTFAFLLVLGIVVDDAIVVGESIHTETHGTGGGGAAAAARGAQLVSKPVIFGVLTTIMAFLPWIFISGSTSEFTRHITWVVILALAFSLIESLLILPAHLSKMEPRQEMGRFGRMQKKLADSILSFADNHYRRMGQWAVKHRYLTASLFVAVLIVGFGAFGTGWVKKGFMPEIESDEIIVNVVLPEGAPYSRALEILAQLQDAEKRLVDEVDDRTGGEGALIENWYTRSRRDSVLAIVKLAPPEVRDMSAKDASIRLRELMGDVPDAKEVSVQYTQGNNDPGFELSVRHPDLDVLRTATAELETQLRTYDSLYDVRNNLEGASEEIRIQLLPGATKLGLTLADVNRQVRQAYFGEEVQRLAREGQDVRVKVRYPEETRRSMESLKNFRVRTSDGREIPLLSVAELEYAPGIKRIQRWNGARAARISADLKDDVRGDIMEDLEQNFFPEWEKRYPGIERGSIGQAEGEKRFIREVMGLYGIAFFAMYSLLAVAFRSYWQPILILIAMPFAFIGAIFGHMAFGMTMAIFSYFGIAAAAGVVVNDNLVLMDYCNRLRDKGMSASEAIVEAGVARFRPIMLTSVTTIVGLMPMMMERSIQAAFLQPIVIALASGVAIAFFVTLFMVPSLYAIGEDITRIRSSIRNKVRLRRGGKAVGAAEQPGNA